MTATKKRVIVVLAAISAGCLVYFSFFRHVPDQDKRVGEKHTMATVRKAKGNKIVLPLPANMAIGVLSFSREGRLFAVALDMLASPDKAANLVQVWDVENKALIREWKKELPGNGSVAIDPDAGRVVLSISGELVHWSIGTGNELWRAAPHRGANDVAFSPDGKLIVTTGPYGLKDNLAVIELWDASSGKRIVSHSPGINSCDAVAFSADGERIAVTGRQEDPSIGVLYVFDRAGKKLLERVHSDGGASAIVFSPQRRWIATSGGAVVLWDADKLTRIAEIQPTLAKSVHEGIFTRLFAVFHPDGETLFLAEDRLEQNVDVEPERLAKLARRHGREGIQIGINELIAKMTANPGTHSTELVFWNCTEAEEADRCRLDLDRPLFAGHMAGICVSADGMRFACARHDSVHIVDLKDEAHAK